MDVEVNSEWVSATTTRNYISRNTLVDWLTLYGKGHGFKKDNELPRYDPRTDFSSYILGQGDAFEAAVIRHLAFHTAIITISHNPGDVRSFQKAQETVEAMASGQPVIAQGVLRDPDSQTYGAPDLLFRSDVLDELFPGTCPPDEARFAAPDIGAHQHHYRVVDIKFTTLELAGDGRIPKATRDLNNWRVYDEADIIRLRQLLYSSKTDSPQSKPPWSKHHFHWLKSPNQ